jgi:hypothetical protein
VDRDGGDPSKNSGFTALIVFKVSPNAKEFLGTDDVGDLGMG